MSIYKKILNIQVKLKAPKGQYNSFGKYNYRNCEDILEALKPLLDENKVTVLISDKPIAVGNRVYIEATVKFVDTETGEIIQTTAMAREEETKKGMDASQITGSASSYARKYALNGMFCIDDTKDSDSLNKGKDEEDKKTEITTQQAQVTEKQFKRLFALQKSAGVTEGKIKAYLQKNFGIDSRKKLSRLQYEKICQDLERMKNKDISLAMSKINPSGGQKYAGTLGM